MASRNATDDLDNSPHEVENTAYIEGTSDSSDYNNGFMCIHTIEHNTNYIKTTTHR